MTRAFAALTLILAAACAPVAQEDEVIIVEPVLEAPAPLAKGAAECAATEVTGDGIGGTGCPAID